MRYRVAMAYAIMEETKIVDYDIKSITVHAKTEVEAEQTATKLFSNDYFVGCTATEC